jgi:uncharacterized membrane protein YdfJ with MMPL/SSD domain
MMKDGVTRIVFSVLLVMAFALAARLMGFTADETVTFFGGALMLAGMLAATQHKPPPR